MDIIEIIEKKKNKYDLDKEEIDYVIDNYMTDKITDYQMSALLMTICINGMKDREIFNITEAMIRNSKILDLSKIEGTIVDKHSTGGVGDKTTLIVVPIVASLGVNVVKMSGRALGFTGGTIDKLESIPGFNVNLSMDAFLKQVNAIHAGISYTSSDLVPVDKKMYALRDVTDTVESIPLIASSIMSKKIASGAKKIVIDVKVGNGALIKNIESATKLSELMIKIGREFDREVVCVLSNMNEPLGKNIGNSLEVLEAIDILNGKGDIKLMTLCIYLSSYMVSLGLNIEFKEAVEKVKEVIKNNSAYSKFLEIVNYQGGNLEDIKVSDKLLNILSDKTGYITEINARNIGSIVHDLGAGRNNINDTIDYGVGIIFNKKVGDYIKQGERLCTVYYNQNNDFENKIKECFIIGDNDKDCEPIVYKIFK